jgi:hypothetical protein
MARCLVQSVRDVAHRALDVPQLQLAFGAQRARAQVVRVLDYGAREVVEGHVRLVVPVAVDQRHRHQREAAARALACLLVLAQRSAVLGLRHARSGRVRCEGAWCMVHGARTRCCCPCCCRCSCCRCSHGV